MFKLLYLLTILSLTLQLDLQDAQILTITRSESKTSFSISKHQKFAIKFSSNPTTGYNWYLLNLEESSKSSLFSFLNLDENGGGEYVPSPIPKKIVGNGGNTFFVLESSEEGTGEVELIFVYKRIWAERNGDLKKTVLLKLE